MKEQQELTAEAVEKLTGLVERLITLTEAQNRQNPSPTYYNANTT
jgi:hypothetical protein